VHRLGALEPVMKLKLSNHLLAADRSGVLVQVLVQQPETLQKEGVGALVGDSLTAELVIEGSKVHKRRFL